MQGKGNSFETTYLCMSYVLAAKYNAPCQCSCLDRVMFVANDLKMDGRRVIRFAVQPRQNISRATETNAYKKQDLLGNTLKENVWAKPAFDGYILW